MRYSKQIALPEVGESGQKKLQAAKVLVIGAGGLGCPAMQYLAGAGIGTIGIVDGDIIEESNLHRQVLFTTSDIGLQKVVVIKKNLEAMNPEICVEVYPEHLTKHNAIDIISEYDLVLDGTDNFATRYLINDACVKLNKPFVSGAIQKFEGQVSVFNFNGGPTYRCLFPDAPKNGQIPNCREQGVLGVLPGIVGVLQATEAMKLILGIGEPLSGKLKLVSILNNEERIIEFNRNPSQLEKAISNWENQDYNHKCFTGPISLTWEAITGLNEDILYLDVRQPYEQPKLEAETVINIPLNELEYKVYDLKSDTTIVVFCQHGIRSMHAVEFIHQHRKNIKLINAEGGIVTNTKFSP